MNKKLILIVFLIGKIGYAQVADSHMSGSSIDFNKVNGNQGIDKLSFTNIETCMKLMEDNILKLMRELGELKMQVHELKGSLKSATAVDLSITRTTAGSEESTTAGVGRSNVAFAQDIPVIVTKTN